MPEEKRRSTDAVNYGTPAQYLLTIIALTMIIVVAITLVAILRPHEDNAAIYAVIASAGGFSLPSIVNIVKGLATEKKLETKIDQNTQLTAKAATLGAVNAQNLEVVKQVAHETLVKANGAATAQLSLTASALAKLADTTGSEADKKVAEMARQALEEHIAGLAIANGLTKETS